ncbi:hypothetical protein OA860_00130 [Prochlorococcus sp. AH-716-E13]|nr:hypothetical protein [Prochlorococcus sp. AH-716-E13]
MSFLFIPLVFFWDPDWLELLGVQPNWALFWLLPWSMIYGPIDGLVVGLFLGLVLDSLSLNSIFTQIPGLVLCGLWFGKLNISSSTFVGHIRYGLICSIASFVCGLLYFFQLLIKYWSDHTIFLYLPSIKNIFAQAFITGLLAPLICSLLLRLFQKSKGRDKLLSFINK